MVVVTANQAESRIAQLLLQAECGEEVVSSTNSPLRRELVTGQAPTARRQGLIEGLADRAVSRRTVKALAHSARATGQEFSRLALDWIWTQTQGQPWLANALCDTACFRSPAGRDRSRAIAKSDIIEAREELGRRRTTHIDQLGPLAARGAGGAHRAAASRRRGVDRRATDIEYARDVGLLASERPTRIANPIYAEVMRRQLALIQ